MKLLVDTHVFIWFILDSPQLGKMTRELLMAPSNQRSISVVSVWEVAIKHSLGKLRLTDGLSGFVNDIQRANFDVLDLTVPHVMELNGLPMHHRDPFDRMLVAQARCENLHLVTVDTALQSYDIPLINGAQ